MTVRVTVLASAMIMVAAACSDPATDAGAPDAASPDTRPTGPTVARCWARARFASGTGEFVAVASGPSGARVFGRSGFWDADHTGATSLESDASVAWSGTQYLVARGRMLTAWDAGMQHRRTLRTFAGGTCNPTLVEVPGGVALVYRRLTHSSEGCERGAGSILFESLAPDGTSRGAPVPLPGPAGDDRASTLRARWDAGRLVVQSWNDSDAERYDVLDVDGSRLANGFGDNVACPRAGCIELIAPGTGADPGATETPYLRGAFVGRNATFESPVQAESVATLAVQHDLVLLVTPSTEASAPSALWIYDAARRQLLTIAEPDGQTVVTHWPLARTPSDLRVVPQPAGFAVVSAPPGTDATLYDVRCDS